VTAGLRNVVVGRGTVAAVRSANEYERVSLPWLDLIEPLNPTLKDQREIVSAHVQQVADVRRLGKHLVPKPRNGVLPTDSFGGENVADCDQSHQSFGSLVLSSKSSKW
jgi:hypothetical protein